MLEIGNTVRYTRLGAGEVVDKVTRKFNGEEREFAVIYLPHKEMTVQVPIGDPVVSASVHEPTSKKDIEYMLKHMEVQSQVLPRTWDIREQEGEEVIGKGDPQDWVNLLGSYAVAHGAGIKVAASDKNIVEQLTELVAAEYLAAGCASDYDEAHKTITGRYFQLSDEIKKRGVSAAHFEAMGYEEQASKLKSMSVEPQAA